jgi:acetyl-CoA carboxylase biotin carboxyl carrier protein
MTAEAPTDGKFYAAPAPEDPPFILPGDFCHEGTVIGIIEAVKIFYKIPAGHSGVVAEVLVSNGDSVASGDPIVKLARPQEPPAVHGNSR